MIDRPRTRPPASMLAEHATALHTPFPALVAALRTAALEMARGELASPPRQVVPLPHDGALLSMVATAIDIAVHKLVSVVPSNKERGLPTVQGHVDVIDSRTGEPLLRLEAATLTGRRTAALSMLGIETFMAEPPGRVLVIGTGAGALHHVMALRALHPAARIDILGRTHEATERFCAAHHFQGAQVAGHADAPTLANAVYAHALHPVARVQDSTADVVITCTTSRVPVYAQPPSPARLVIATGAWQAHAAEIHPALVRASRCYVDEGVGAHHEAGDLVCAEVDWATVTALQDVLAGEASRPQPGEAVLFKTVGCAAWDLAGARVALATAA
ncbi:MAG TPA: delta(1)-pyrroline-2-carboxylate reductase family protein [Burkholderiaceae bacterium]|nr:delta(1)-pyrroline-2-carboxylate reductase family protein [Burkholderiaceae bacterium]